MAVPRTRCVERGDNSILTSTPKVYRLNGRDVMRLEFRACLEDGEPAKRITVTRDMPCEPWQIKKAAYKKLDEMLSNRSTLAGWSPRSSMAEFVESKIVGEYFDAYLRTENTKVTYRRLMLSEYCPRVKGQTIRSACSWGSIEETLQSIANTKPSTAKQVAKVLRAHVMPQLVRYRLIERNELAYNKLRLREPHKPARTLARATLTIDERRRVIEYLLNADTHAHARGGIDDEQATAQREKCIDVTLLQAYTGLRIGEVRELSVHDVRLWGLDDGRKRFFVIVRPEVSKTQKGRVVAIADDDVKNQVGIRLGARVLSSPEEGYLFPSGNGTQWDRSNAQKALRRLYNELADELGIPLLREVSTHVWRATLNTIYAGEGMSDALRAKFFGHTEDANARYYMDFDAAKSLAHAFDLHTDVHTTPTRKEKGQPKNVG